jgi:hypothetical protein
MANIERWFLAIETLPAKYPAERVGEVFAEVVEWYLGNLSFDETVKLLRETPTPLIADLLEIFKAALEETRGSGGDGAGRPVAFWPGPGPRVAAAAKDLPRAR